ncbi:MAG: M20/M25/M40 family metallo-hydrolase [Gemmatimonadota bacterium]|nr:M20/M25/M40 family metallo-hydrolase [Gemmatimonadota bacterium]
MRLSLLLLTALVAAPLHAQSDTLTGYTPPQAGRERTLERLLRSLGDTAFARRHSQFLSAEAHVAGTPAQQRTARYVLEQMRAFGLDTSRTEFQVFIPYPESTVVELVRPVAQRLSLTESPVAGDASSQGSIWPAMNGHAAPGDVTAPLVYVNFGLPDDYRLLDSLGVEVTGRIAVARYGRSFRGIKAREAEQHGAAGLLLYSDPQDDGYVVGDVYPEGPMRPSDGVQRGSILNGIGDPASPGWAATADARRLAPAQMDLPRIPVVPVGYGNAALLLQPLRGRAVPQAWQGGLPFRYHLGDDETTARVALWREPDSLAWKRITNTAGVLKGSTWPDELVIVGGHRDAWGPGAVDNVSGVTSILEAARMLAAAAGKGYRPKRTIVFATWDAEEWGVMGSTEWVEAQEERLAAHAVAYLNLDVSVSGQDFGASGTSSLHPLLRELTRLVDQPYDSTTVYTSWRRKGNVADTADVSVGDLGGGSDFAGFYNHLGIPAAGFGFGGPGGVYHSAYDSYDWMRRFGDSGFQAHVTAGTIAALFLSRLGNADVVPFDYGVYARYLDGLVTLAAKLAMQRNVAADFSTLRASIAELGTAATAWEQARNSLLRRPAGQSLLARINRELRLVEQSLTRPTGLVGRPWYRNIVFASDRDNGYATVALPGVVEAIRAGDAALTAVEIADLAAGVGRAADAIRRAAALAAAS